MGRYGKDGREQSHFDRFYRHDNGVITFSAGSSMRVRPVVLVVEDEPLLRIATLEFLAEAGCEAIEARDADEAIAILERRPDIHVVFTDIQMPGSMDGLKLAHFVRHRWPPIKIIATSGHVRITVDDLPQGGRFLRKPYTPDEVTDTIRELMAA